MALTDALELENAIVTVTSYRFTLDGKKVNVLQNFTITGNLQGDLLVEFDGERFDTYTHPDRPEGQLGIKVLDGGREGKYGVISYHNMSEKAAEKGGRIVVQKITVDEHGPTFHLITIRKEEEQ